MIIYCIYLHKVIFGPGGKKCLGKTALSTAVKVFMLLLTRCYNAFGNDSIAVGLSGV